MKKALLIIDMQKDFFQKPNLIKKQRELIANINELILKARKEDIPIIWVRQEHEADLSDAPLYFRKNNIHSVIRGTKGAALIEGLKPGQTDYEIIKKRYSAFLKTNLEKILKKIKVDTLIITGINTMSCIRTTATDAYQLDYNLLIPRECVYGHDIEQHENSLQYL